MHTGMPKSRAKVCGNVRKKRNYLAKNSVTLLARLRACRLLQVPKAFNQNVTKQLKELTQNEFQKGPEQLGQVRCCE